VNTGPEETMVNARYWLAFAVALAVCACGETASVGELRCVGESTHCDQSRFTDSEVSTTSTFGEAVDAGAPEVLPEGEAEIVWTEDLSCASETCWAPQVVVDDDGSLTVAAEVYDADPSHESTVGGTWIGRYGTDGTLLAENDDLVERALDVTGPTMADDPVAAGLFTLAATARGTLLVGSIGEEPDIFAVADDGKPTPLWKSSRGIVDSIASIGDDLLVSGTFSVVPHKPGLSMMFPEVARYDRDGELVWRQTALQAADPGGASARSNMPMVVRKDGRSFVVALDYGWSSRSEYWRRLIALTPEGNVSWASTSFLDFDERNAQIALTSKGDVVVAHGAYMLDVYYHPVGNPDKWPELRSVSRFREQYWNLSVLGFAIDAEDRLLVATNEGDHDARRFIIDRYSPDLAQRQTFALSDSDVLGDDPRSAEDEGWTPTISGMRVGREGELYVWSTKRLVRLELP
jgi:hypothetical protein